MSNKENIELNEEMLNNVNGGSMAAVAGIGGIATGVAGVALHIASACTDDEKAKGVMEKVGIGLEGAGVVLGAAGYIAGVRDGKALENRLDNIEGRINALATQP